MAEWPDIIGFVRGVTGAVVEVGRGVRTIQQTFGRGDFGEPFEGGPVEPPPSVQLVSTGSNGINVGDFPLTTQLPGGNGMANGGVVGACAPRPRLAPAVIVNNPCTGAPHVYKNMGAVSTGLFSGDFRAHKRVNKLASKAARGRPRRRKR